jgi:hypothetical protein
VTRAELERRPRPRALLIASLVVTPAARPFGVSGDRFAWAHPLVGLPQSILGSFAGQIPAVAHVPVPVRDLDGGGVPDASDAAPFDPARHRACGRGREPRGDGRARALEAPGGRRDGDRVARSLVRKGASGA